jgi:hypothetical protein
MSGKKGVIDLDVYQRRYRQLHKVGGIQSMGKALRLTPAKKGQISKQWKKYRYYLTNKAVKFVRENPKTKRYAKLASTTPKHAHTKKGIFLVKSSGNYNQKLYVTSKGEWGIKTDTSTSVVVPIEKKLFMRSPKSAYNKAIKGRKFDGVRLHINGVPQPGGSFEPEKMERYITEWKTWFEGNKEDFAEIFTFELLTFDE